MLNTTSTVLVPSLARLLVIAGALLGLARPAAAQARVRVDPRVSQADLARIQGSPGAKAWMLIASDFQCPYCKAFHDTTFAKIKKEFVDTGKLRVAYIHFPLRNHANALPAAEASMCAGAQDKFWPYHDKLFAATSKWSQEKDATATFERLASELKLNMDSFRACMREDVMLNMISADRERASKQGVTSTPTFLIGNMTTPGLAPLDVFRSTINQALAGGMK